MAFDLTGISSVTEFATHLLDRFVPDPAQKSAAALEVLKAQQAGEFKEIDSQLEAMKTAVSTINTEGASQDKWTSRARPSFMYVIYLLILTAIPMGILSVFSPSAAHQIIVGFHEWLAAIPDNFVQLFGVGYLGYTGFRSFDKHTEAKVTIAGK